MADINSLLTSLYALQNPEAAQKNALRMGLLSFGSGLLANNRGNYGALAPALGAGLQAALPYAQQYQNLNMLKGMVPNTPKYNIDGGQVANISQQPGNLTGNLINNATANVPSAPQQSPLGNIGFNPQQALPYALMDAISPSYSAAMADRLKLTPTQKDWAAQGIDPTQMRGYTMGEARNKALPISPADQQRIALERARAQFEGVTLPPEPNYQSGQPAVQSVQTPNQETQNFISRTSKQVPMGNIRYQGQDLSKLSPKDRQELIAKRTAEMPKDLTSMEDMIAKTDATTDQAKAILNHPGLSAATGMEGVVAGRIPGTKAFDAAKLIDTLRNEVMLSQLQAFRAASANGSSGFGQLSNAEGETLRNAITNLDRAQSETQFKQALNSVIKTNEAIKDRMRNGYQRLYGEQPKVNEYHTNETLNSLTAGKSQTAPQSALDFLKAHPETSEQFKAKYGYVP